MLLACSIILVFLLCFGFVILYGAPYVPTLTPQVTLALTLAELKPGQHLLELGCGDGKVLLAAAQQGIRATGYELNPVMWAVAWLRTRRHRRLVSVRLANLWTAQWPAADVIFVFLLPKFMPRLDTRIAQLDWPVRLISFAFPVPGRRPSQQQQGVYVYNYRPRR